MNDLERVKREDPFLVKYQPSELIIASEFLSTWLPFLSRYLCHRCTQTLSQRIRSLDPGDAGLANPDLNAIPSTPNNYESEELNENLHDNSAVNSIGSSQDDDTNSLGSWKDRENGWSEPIGEASTSGGVASVSPLVRTPASRLSWADMAQDDELEEVEEEEEEQLGSESSKRIVSLTAATRELRISKGVEKPKLPRDQREYIRFMNVKRRKDFICFERVDGMFVNILEGLELHEGIFSAAEQKRIVDHIYLLQDMGRKGELKECTYTAPQKWMRGKGRVTIQFGCCYNYAVDKNGNPPGILQNELVDPIPDLFKVVDAGEFSGPIAIPLPVGSVLVLNGNGADIAKHCVPAVPTKRLSITFRRMDELKRPVGYTPEPDLQGIEPLTYDAQRPKGLNSPRSVGAQRPRGINSPISERRVKGQPFRRGEAKGFTESNEQLEHRSSTQPRRGSSYKRKFTVNQSRR
ncbi:2-oxoglutarate and Fe(II)-dependent oxygenase superfamily protein isoform 2 [Hibiscus syriacus]|uniref:2-oxoglutarate and Fe(II)-dependent oxygenase superfamily protein isoform 2 n=1 Tax=Hibiscus syriacus TaxID=106335 RepID=A0A6A2ZVG5_HIBSY|nr:2-oxoglutarate and Fe(II)-dependent oxygenase superfamily protein isoform 2 [Hibiscus syriacus]